eukprot:Awhi_evm1s12761
MKNGKCKEKASQLDVLYHTFLEIAPFPTEETDSVMRACNKIERNTIFKNFVVKAIGLLNAQERRLLKNKFREKDFKLREYIDNENSIVMYLKNSCAATDEQYQKDSSLKRSSASV